MSELPRGWTSVKIGEACRLVNGRAFKPSDWTSKGLPIVRIQNLNDPRAHFNCFSGHVEEKFVIDSGELLFAWSGTPGTSFGAHIWERGKAALNQHIYRVFFDEERFDKRFLRHAINARLDHLIGVAHGGAGRAHVTKGVFEATEILQPPLAEQRRIVARLESLTARSRRAKEALDAVPALLEELRRSVLDAAFRGDLSAAFREENRDVEPAEVLLRRIRAERRIRWEAKSEAQEPLDPRGLPALPAGWVWAAGRELFSWSRGRVLGKDQVRGGDVPIYGGNGISGRHSEANVQASTIVVGRVGTHCGNVHVTEGAAWVGDNAMFASSVPAGISLEYVGHALRCAKLNEHAGGSGQPFVSRAVLDEVAIPLPPVAEQVVILEKIGEAERRIQRVAQAMGEGVREVAALERAILGKAFRGELVE